MRNLPEDEGLAIADSAMRHDFSARRLALLAASARGPRTDRIRRVAARARREAANVFESSLRAIALTVPDLQVEPQVSVREPHFLVRRDLVDERLRITLEQTASSGTANAPPCDATPSATTPLLCTGGWCFGSPTKT